MFDAPPRLSSIIPNTDLGLDELLNRMLSKEPENRPSMREVKAQLKNIDKNFNSNTIRDKFAKEVSDISQAETLVYRSSEHSATAYIPAAKSNFYQILLQKRTLLFTAISIGFIAILTIIILIRNSSTNRRANDSSTPSQVDSKIKPEREDIGQTTQVKTPEQQPVIRIPISNKSNISPKSRPKSKPKSIERKESIDSLGYAPKIID